MSSHSNYWRHRAAEEDVAAFLESDFYTQHMVRERYRDRCAEACTGFADPNELRAQHAELLRVLELTEMLPYPKGVADDGKYCPWCYHGTEHAPDCPRQAIIERCK